METNKSIGEKIAELRKEKGCTQADLGSYLNISYQAVSKWERGESCPDFTTMSKLAQYFSVPISYFEDGGEKGAGLENRVANLENLVTNLEKNQETKEEKSPFIKCPFCGRETARAHIHCDYCRGYFGDRFGAELPKPKQSQVQAAAKSSQVKYCKTCGKMVGVSEIYCPHCRSMVNTAGSVKYWSAPTGAVNGWAIAAIFCIGLLGLIFGILGIKRAERTGTGKTLSTVAIVLSVIWVSLCILAYIGIAAGLVDYGGYYY